MSREDELQYSEFFIAWSNRAFSTDYKARINPEENSAIDVFARSESNQYPELKLQLVTSHGSVYQNAARNTKASKIEDAKAIDIDFEKWIMEVIKKKSNLYPDGLKRELIVLIQGSVPTPLPSIIKSLKLFCAEYPFRGIYYVSLPVFSSDETEDTKNGFVIPLKEVV